MLENSANSTETKMIKRRTMTVEEAAQALGISRNGAYAAVRRGEIPAIKIGDRRLVPIVAIERLLEGKESGPMLAGEK
jgi:excisionase family DNA binding protein